jgi:hypothetical protein
VADTVRLLDTRSGSLAGPVEGLTQVTVSSDVPIGAVVELTITATNESGLGYVAAYPDGSAAPTTSNLNYRTNVTKAATAFVLVPESGVIDLNVANAATNLIVDQQGYATSDELTGLDSRIGDTRNGTGFTGLTDGPQSGVVTLTLPTAEQTAGLVALNVTAVPKAYGLGHITAFSSSPVPATSSVNYSFGEDESNLVFVKPSTTGTVSFDVVGEPASVVVDLEGSTPVGSTFLPTTPTRLADSRTATGLPQGPLSGTQTLSLGTLPAGTTAVALNVAATGETKAGYTVVYPTGTTKPVTSQLQFPVTYPIAQTIVVPVSASASTVSIYILGDTQLVVDLAATVGAEPSSG